MNDDHPNAPGGPNDTQFDDAPERQNDKPRSQSVQGPLNALEQSALAVDLAAVEIDRLIATAHRFPRNLEVVRDQLDQIVCFDEASADNAVYALPRAGKAIVGPSIGFANALAGAYGNCWDDSRWLYTDRKEKIVVGGGVFVDFQSNRRVTMSEQRRIVDSKGRLFSDDMIVVTSKAAGAIARRNAILAGIPRPLWHPIYDKALRIVRGTEEQLVDRRDRAVRSLAAFGITPALIFAYLGVRELKEIGIEHIPTLRGMFQQLRDGSVTVEEMFDPRRMTSGGFESAGNVLGGDPEGAGAPRSGSTAEVERRTATEPAAAGQGGDAGSPAAQGGEGDKGAADGQPAGSASQSKGRGGGKTRKAAEPTAEKDAEPKPAAAEAKPEPKPEPKPAEKPAPKTPEEYEAHHAAWLAAQTSATGASEKWKGEKDLRTSCRVTEDVYDRCKRAQDAKVAALKAQG